MRPLSPRPYKAAAPKGPAFYFLCGIGLNTPSNIDEKTSDVGLLGGVRAACGPPSALRPYYSASGLLSKPPHGGPGWEPKPSRHACHSLPSSTSNHSAGLSACLITETCRRAELNGLGQRLFVHACHLFMGQLVSFGDREPSDRALLAKLFRVFPPQPSEPALPAV